MDITYYNNSMTFLVVALFLGVIVFGFYFVFGGIYIEGHDWASEIISTIVAIVVSITTVTLFCFHGMYSSEYRKQAYEQCRNYMQEQYHVEIVRYDQKDSVYIRGEYAKIKTYFYSNGKKYYVEYEVSLLTNGIIQYQSANIW